jgi:hypothetical protein
MSDTKRECAERHAREVDESQRALRESISETERLVGESEKMLRVIAASGKTPTTD